MILLAVSEGPDQTARMRRVIWAFAVRICPPEDTFSHSAAHLNRGYVYRNPNRKCLQVFSLLKIAENLLWTSSLITLASLQTNTSSFLDNVGSDVMARNTPSRPNLHCLPFCFGFCANTTNFNNRHSRIQRWKSVTQKLRGEGLKELKHSPSR